MIRQLILGIALCAASTGCQTIPAKDLAEAIPGKTFDAKGDYIIGNGDDIGVRVHGDDTLSGTFTVGANGLVSLPLVGFLPATGLTIQQIHERLDGVLQPLVKKTSVSAWVVSRKSFHAYFCGEVSRVGLVQLDDKITLLQALSLAGGPTPFASGRIVLIRPASDGHMERYAVTYERLLKGGDLFDRFHLERGDTVVVE